MKTNTNQSRITGPYRDRTRENNFFQYYKLEATIITTNFNDENFNWDKVILEFIFKGEKYYIVEHFKENEDNSTDFVELMYNGVVRKFDRFIDAETTMVNLMKEKLNG